MSPSTVQKRQSADVSAAAVNKRSKIQPQKHANPAPSTPQQLSPWVFTGPPGPMPFCFPNPCFMTNPIQHPPRATQPPHQQLQPQQQMPCGGAASTPGLPSRSNSALDSSGDSGLSTPSTAPYFPLDFGDDLQGDSEPDVLDDDAFAAFISAFLGSAAEDDRPAVSQPATGQAPACSLPKAHAAACSGSPAMPRVDSAEATMARISDAGGNMPCLTNGGLPLSVVTMRASAGGSTFDREFSSGQSPSYRQNHHPFIIGVAGGTASGKTTVCDMIMQRLHDQCVVMLSQDFFYRALTPAESADVKNYDFDDPSAFDEPAILDTLLRLKQGLAVELPIYDFARHARSEETKRVEPADVVILEGILVLAMPRLLEQLNMKIYVDTDDDVRLARRIQRDVACRGRDVAGVIQQYTRFVKPAFDRYIGPSRRHADIIVPWQTSNNIVAIDLITEHIRLKLKQHDLLRIHPNLEVIPSNFQIRGMHTILRDATTSKNDFVFYANRLNRLVVEAGLGHLPFVERTVNTPAGSRYVGVDFARGICGVSVIRSGEAMENALRECCQGIKIGKILVHRHGASEELVYEKLPADVANRFVLILDPVLGTGNTACKTIQILRERGVKIVTSEIDMGVDSEFRVVPGMGEFGDRYFCD
ncbi:MAG: hypothetical protein WDW38_007681 [Sanguina aurantia]